MKNYRHYRGVCLLLVIGLWTGTAPASAAAMAMVETEHIVMAIKTGIETNAKRAQQGLEPLVLDPTLYSLAFKKALTMASLGEYGHTLSDGVTLDQLLENNGYHYQTAGENIAFGFEDEKAVVMGWMNSPVHARNLFSSSYTDVGIAVIPMYYDGRTGFVFVQIFGHRMTN